MVVHNSPVVLPCLTTYTLVSLFFLISILSPLTLDGRRSYRMATYVEHANFPETPGSCDGATNHSGDTAFIFVQTV